MLPTDMADLTTGIQMEYHLAGGKGGEALLFLHGLGPTLQQFEPQVASFTPHYRVLLPSLRGHGRSTSPVKATLADYTARELARDVQALLDYLELDRIHFVGNSLGGLVGYELLEMEPARLASLTTFGTTAELHASRATS